MREGVKAGRRPSPPGAGRRSSSSHTVGIRIHALAAALSCRLRRRRPHILDLFRGVVRPPCIRKLFLFELKDSKSLPGCGLLRLDGTQKQPYVEITRFIRSQGIPAGLPRPRSPR